MSENISQVFASIYDKTTGKWQIDVCLTDDAFENGNYVYFVIRSDISDKYESDNEISFGISHMTEKTTPIDNPYYEALQIAKSFAGIL